nr:MAG TPA: putative transcriptional regulator [Caudoviricetes sp.]
MSRTGLKRANIYLRMKNGTFPKNISIGAKNVVWLESEIMEWMQEKINQRNQTE